MKKLSTTLLADIVQSKRKSLKMTQAQLSELTGINRAQLSRLEQEDYCPLIPQLEKLGDVLDFDINDVFVNTAASKLPSPSPPSHRSGWNRIRRTVYLCPACTA